MPTDLATINSILYEHGAIRHHVQTFANAVKELEEVFVKKLGEWDPSVLKTITDKRLNLQQSLQSLYEGVKIHHDREESVMAPLIGSQLMEGLMLEHEDMMQNLERTKTLLSESEVAVMSREELMAQSYEIRHVTDYVCELIGAHITKEDAILDLLKKAIRARQAS